MVFERNTSRKQLKLGGQLLEMVSSSKHLGVSLKYMMDSCVSKCIQGFYACLGLGNRYQPVPHLCLSKLYGSHAIPQMTHGLELVYLSRREE